MTQTITSTFTIRIRQAGDGCTIQAEGSNKQTIAPEPFPTRQDLLKPEHEATLAEMAKNATKVEPKAIQALGEILYNALFKPRPIMIAFSELVGQAKLQGGRVRLCLEIEVPALAALPWEALHDGEDWFLNRSDALLVRRFPQEADLRLQLPVAGKLKILFVGGFSPANMPNLDAKIEKLAEDLRAAFQGAEVERLIAFDVLLQASLEQIQKAMANDYNVICFAGHGEPNGIYLNDYGSPTLTSAKILAEKGLLDRGSVRLVFLAACKTAATDPETQESFAQALSREVHLPAVVAMQYYVSIGKARALVEQFFVSLAAFQPVDVALADARRSILGRDSQVVRDVVTPVMFLQAEDGALFKKKRNWFKIALFGILPVLAVLGVLLYLVFQDMTAARKEAAIERLSAQSRGLAAYAESALNRDPELALLLSLEMWQGVQELDELVQDDEYVRPLDAEATLRQALTDYYPSLKLQLRYDSSQIFSPDGTRLGTLSSSYGVADSVEGKDLVEVWNTSTGQRVSDFSVPDAIRLLTFNQDSSLVAIVTGKRDEKWNVVTSTLQVRNTSSGTLVAEFRNDLDFCQIAFTSDRNLLIGLNSSNCYDSYYKEITVWNLSSQKLEWEQHVSNAALNADGSRIAVFNYDYLSRSGSIVVWDLDSIVVWDWDTLTKQIIFRMSLDVSSDHIIVRLNADGTVVAALDTGTQTVYWFDITEIPSRFSRKLPAKDVIDITLSNDGSKLGLVYTNTWYGIHRVELYDIQSGNILEQSSFNEAIQRLSLEQKDQTLSPDGSKLMIDDFYNKTVWLWDFEEERMTARLRGHLDNIYNLNFDYQGKMLATGSSDVVNLWKTNDVAGQFWLSLAGHVGGVRQMVFSPIDAPLLAVVSHQDVVSLWDLAKGTKREIPMPGNQIAFHPQGNIIAVANPNGHISLHAVQSGDSLTMTKAYHNSSIDFLSFSLDGNSLFSASNGDHLFQTWDVETLDLINTITFTGKIVAFDNQGQGRLVTSPFQEYSSGGYEAGGGERLWDAFESEVSSFECPTVYHVGAFLPQNDLFVGNTPRGDYTVPVCSTRTGRRLDTLELEGVSLAMAFAVSADGERFAAFTGEPTRARVGIELWDMNSREKIVHIDDAVPFEPGLPSIGLSKNGHRIAVSAREAGITDLWEVTSGEVITSGEKVGQLSQNNGYGSTVVQFSPTCITLPIGDAPRCVELVATATVSGTTIMVDLVNPDDVRNLACDRLNRNLTLEEWKLYVGNEPYRCTCSRQPPHPSVIEASFSIAKDTCPVISFP